MWRKPEQRHHASQVQLAGRSRCRRCARRWWPACRRCGRACTTRSGPSRTTVKSEVPPPMSTTSTSDFARDAALVVEGGGDGLELERRRRSKPAPRGSPAARRLRARGRAVGSSSTKCTGRPMHDPRGHAPPSCVSARCASSREKARDDVLEAHHAVRPTAVCSCISAAAQQALERAHQPAFGAGQVERRSPRARSACCGPRR